MNPRDLLQRLMDAEGIGANALAARTNHKTKQPQIYRFIKGISKEPKRSTLEPVAKYFGIPVDAFFSPTAADEAWATRTSTATRSGSYAAPNSQSKVLVAQELSHQTPIITPITLPWESLMDKLPDEFKLVLTDNAMAPEFPAGSTAIFSTVESPPRAHDAVLVRDKHGNHYLREFRARTPDHWHAVALNPGHAPLDSVSDGLVTIAICIGKWGRRGQ